MPDVIEPTVILAGNYFYVELPGGERTAVKHITLPLHFTWQGKLNVAFSPYYEHSGVYRLLLVSTATVDGTR